MTTTPLVQTAAPIAKGAFKGLDPKLVETTQKWVSQTFFGTLLKQMRDSPFRSELFDGGRGGQAFGAMHDQQLAERMGRSVGTKLVRAIVRRIEAKKAYEQAAMPGENRSTGFQPVPSDVAAHSAQARTVSAPAHGLETRATR